MSPLFIEDMFTVASNLQWKEITVGKEVDYVSFTLIQN